MAACRIIGLCILAAVLYGVVHDQVTARVCLEYFTIGHPRILDTESPTLLGLAWGILGTWWVGLLLGALLAFAAIRGSRPKRTARSLIGPIACLLGCMAGVSLVAGLVGYTLAANGTIVLAGPLAAEIPRDRHVAFLAVAWAHGASYVVGLVGGLVLARRVWHCRRHAPFGSPEELDAFVTETRARLRELGFEAASDVLARVQDTAYTTGSEWRGELGLAIRDIESRCPLPRELAIRIARIRVAVGGAWQR